MRAQQTKRFSVTITEREGPMRSNMPSDDQMLITPKGELFVVYNDDHDEENEDGGFSLHDVTNQYYVSVEKS